MLSSISLLACFFLYGLEHESNADIRPPVLINLLAEVLQIEIAKKACEIKVCETYGTGAMLQSSRSVKPNSAAVFFYHKLGPLCQGKLTF